MTEVKAVQKEAKPESAAPAAEKRGPQRGRGGNHGGRGQRRGRRGQDRKPFVRQKPEFEEQVIDLRRVVRVMAGGKRFRFRATLVIGDKKGRVGIGMGKGGDVQQSIQKAKNKAKKNLIIVQMNKGTIPHQVDAKYSAARVLIKPAKEGNGLVAGGAVRTVLHLAGVNDATAKCLGRTTNKVTNALATIDALKQLKPARKSKKKEAAKPVVEKKVAPKKKVAKESK
ncbi:MAG: 30S ribosomal protein S5 [Candidatus Paceibacterota bacterium]